MNRFGNGFRRLPTLLLAFYWSALFVGTHLPGPRVHIDVGHDKLAHFAGFAGLAFLFVWAMAACRQSRKAAVVAILVLMVYGALDELTQMLVPNRSCDVWDWSADVTGAIAGLAFYGVTVMVWGVLGGPLVRNSSVAAPHEIS